MKKKILKTIIPEGTLYQIIYYTRIRIAPITSKRVPIANIHLVVILGKKYMATRYRKPKSAAQPRTDQNAS